MSDLIDQLISDRKLLQAFGAIVDFGVGEYVFEGLVLTVILSVIYIRYQSFIPVGIAIALIFGYIMMNIPTPFIPVVVLFMASIVAIILTRAIMRSRV